MANKIGQNYWWLYNVQQIVFHDLQSTVKVAKTGVARGGRKNLF